HGDAPRGEVGLGDGDGELVVVEDAGGQGGVGLALGQHAEQVIGVAGPAGGDDGDADGLGDGAGHLEVVAGLGAVGVHGGQHDRAGAEPLDLFGPRDGLQTRGDAAAVDVDLPDGAPVALDPAGVDVDDGGAAAELAGHLADEV